MNTTPHLMHKLVQPFCTNGTCCPADNTQQTATMHTISQQLQGSQQWHACLLKRGSVVSYNMAFKLTLLHRTRSVPPTAPPPPQYTCITDPAECHDLKTAPARALLAGQLPTHTHIKQVSSATTSASILHVPISPSHTHIKAQCQQAGRTCDYLASITHAQNMTQMDTWHKLALAPAH